MRNGVSPALPRRRSTLVMRRRRRRRWPGHSSWQSRWPKAQIQVASACRNREPRLLQPRPQLGPTVTQAQLLRPQATSQCKLRLVLYNNLKVYNIVNYAIRSRISIGRCAIKILNQLKRFTDKRPFFIILPLYGAHRPFLWVPSGFEPGGILSWKVAKGIPPCHLSHSVT